MTKGNRQGSFRQSTIDVFALITIDKKTFPYLTSSAYSMRL